MSSFSIRTTPLTQCNVGKNASQQVIGRKGIAMRKSRRSIRFFGQVLFLILNLIVMRSALAQTDSGRALAATCATCHGIDGQAKQGMKPLAGKSAAEIVVLMKAFRSAGRHATIMHQIAKGYTDDQIELIAKYFSSQAVPSQAKP